MNILSECFLAEFDLWKVLPQLDGIGATSFPFLTRRPRELFYETARSLTYAPLPRSASKGRVIQEIDSCKHIPDDSIFRTFAKDYERFVLEKIEQFGQNPLATDFTINDIGVQRYLRGSLGITTHVDGKSYLNLVSLFIIDGYGKFFVCDNRAGDNPVQIETSPGNLLLMRANGFMAHTNTPFHRVGDIQFGDRYVLGLRQKNTPNI